MRYDYDSFCMFLVYLQILTLLKRQSYVGRRRIPKPAETVSPELVGLSSEHFRTCGCGILQRPVSAFVLQLH